MHWLDKLNIPGEHRLTLEGRVGDLEGLLTVPNHINTNHIAILGHPHSLQGGTMNNKVVTSMARVFKDLGIMCLRFNFRGVGLSQGEYDAGLGESEDMLGLVRLWREAQPQVNFIFAGFSFGSYVAYRTAAQTPHSLLITIAPPVHHYPYREFEPAPSPWLIIQGDEDEVVPANLVAQFAEESTLKLPIIHFPNTGHFFHGQLVNLKNQLTEYLIKEIQLS